MCAQVFDPLGMSQSELVADSYLGGRPEGEGGDEGAAVPKSSHRYEGATDISLQRRQSAGTAPRSRLLATYLRMLFFGGGVDVKQLAPFSLFPLV